MPPKRWRIHFGPKIGGLLNATLGTLTELIIMFALLRSGQTELLKASIVGSILISLLLTVGAAILFGGLRHGIQRFDKESVGMASTTMILAMVGLFVPTFLSFAIQMEQRPALPGELPERHGGQPQPGRRRYPASSCISATVIYQLRSPAGEEHLAQKPSAARPPGPGGMEQRPGGGYPIGSNFGQSRSSRRS